MCVFLLVRLVRSWLPLFSAQKKSHSTRSQQQEIFLRERYAEFKEAALNAKKNNDIELAKKYLRLMKVWHNSSY